MSQTIKVAMCVGKIGKNKRKMEIISNFTSTSDFVVWVRTIWCQSSCLPARMSPKAPLTHMKFRETLGKRKLKTLQSRCHRHKEHFWQLKLIPALLVESMREGFYFVCFFVSLDLQREKGHLHPFPHSLHSYALIYKHCYWSHLLVSPSSATLLRPADSTTTACTILSCPWRPPRNLWCFQGDMQAICPKGPTIWIWLAYLC